MNFEKNNKNLRSTGVRIAFIDRVIFQYRVGFFARIAKEYNMVMFHGKSVPDSKVVNAIPPYPFFTKKMFTICKRSKKNPLQVLYFNPACVFDLLRWKPELIVIDESNMLNNLFIYLYCKFFSVKYIFWGLGQVPGRKDSIYRKVLTPARKFIIRRATCCLAYCDLSARYFKCITESKKVKVLPNSIDNESVEEEIVQITKTAKANLRKKLGIPENGIILLFVGALQMNKRLDVFLEALKILTDRRRNVYGLIIGSGIAESYYREFADNLGLKNCKFIGKIFKGVNSYFQISDIFVLPGRGGLAINQAMINSLPVICNTPADGTELDMLQDGENGFLIESMDVPKLTDALERIIENTCYIRMGRNARAVIEKRYNINAMLAVFREVVQDLSL